MVWLQTGLTYDSDGYQIYAEMNYGPTDDDVESKYEKVATMNWPFTWGPNDYKIERDPDDPRYWYFYINDENWRVLYHDVWWQVVPDEATFATEVVYKEDRMCGSSSSRCVFSSCAYSSGNVWSPAGLLFSDVEIDPPSGASEFDFNLQSQVVLEVWDKNP